MEKGGGREETKIVKISTDDDATVAVRIQYIVTHVVSFFRRLPGITVSRTKTRQSYHPKGTWLAGTSESIQSEVILSRRDALCKWARCAGRGSCRSCLQVSETLKGKDPETRPSRTMVETADISA